MTDLVNLIPGEAPPTCVQATIAAAPVDGEVYVTVPSFDTDQRFGPCYFTPQADREPARGDLCLVAFDEERQPWVVVWVGS